VSFHGAHIVDRSNFAALPRIFMQHSFSWKGRTSVYNSWTFMLVLNIIFCKVLQDIALFFKL
jgi:hypothetical protein